MILTILQIQVPRKNWDVSQWTYILPYISQYRVKTGWKAHATAQNWIGKNIKKNNGTDCISCGNQQALSYNDKWKNSKLILTVNWRMEKTEIYREQSNGNWNIKNKTWTNLDIWPWSTVDLRAENVALQGCGMCIKYPYTELPASSRRAFIYGVRRSVLGAKGLLSLWEGGILFNSVSLNNTLTVSCLQPRSSAGVKNLTITDSKRLEQLVYKDYLRTRCRWACCETVIFYKKNSNHQEEHKRKTEWNNFTTKHGLDLFCLACCVGDYYFSQTEQKKRFRRSCLWHK